MEEIKSYGLRKTLKYFHFWVNWSLKRVQPFLTNSIFWGCTSIKPEAGCSWCVNDRTGLFLLLIVLGAALSFGSRGTRPWVWRKQHLLFTDTDTLVSQQTLRLGYTEAARQRWNSFDSSAGFWLAESFLLLTDLKYVSALISVRNQHFNMLQ